MLVPQVTLAAARLAALRKLTQLRGVPFADNPKWPFALAIGSPNVRDAKEVSMLSFLRPDEAARVATGEGRLVYSGQFVGGDPDDHTIPRISIMDDALDGRILSTRDWAYGRGGPGAGSGKSLAVPTDVRAWRVAGEAGDWTAPAMAALVPVNGSAPTGAKLTLTDGKAAFPAVYDARTGMLGISGKAYCPGPALAIVLRKRAR